MSVTSDPKVPTRTTESFLCEDRDWSLVRKFAAEGCQESFRQIYKKYEPFVRYSLAKKLAKGQIQDLPEISNMVWERMAKTLSRFDGRVKLSTWIYPNIGFALLSFYQQKARQNKLQTVSGLPHGLEKRSAFLHKHSTLTDHFTDRVGPYREYIMQQFAERLEDFLEEGLTPDERDVYFGVEMEGQTLQEIANDLGSSYSTVYKRFQRAKEKVGEVKYLDLF